MIIKSIEGDMINQALTSAMLSTLQSLVDEGICDPEKAKNYANSHVCLCVDKSCLWSKIREWIGFDSGNENDIKVVCFKVATNKNKEDQ